MDEKILGRVADASYSMVKTGISPMEFMESFRPTQIASKKWLVQEVCNFRMHWDRVLVLGSWNGVLLYELFNTYGDVNCFDFLDNDPLTHKHRDIYFEVNDLPKNYNSIEMDATEFSDHESYDLVINTSCEHMPDIPAIYGPLYALQSSDQEEVDDHINCIKETRQLSTKNNINKRMLEGKRSMGSHHRYMVIGYYQ